MQVIFSEGNFSCRATRLGNSFMQGTQLVDHRSTTTTFPFCAAINASVSFQLLIVSVTALAWAPEDVLSGLSDFGGSGTSGAPLQPIDSSAVVRATTV